MTFALREVLVFLVWVPLALPVGIAYGTFLAHVLDRNPGMAGGAVVVVFPLAILFFAGVIWLPVWGFLRQSWRRRLGVRAPAAALVLVACAAFVVCQANCFRFGGSEPFLAYFVMVPVAAAAYLHDRWSRAWLAAPVGAVS